MNYRQAYDYLNSFTDFEKVPGINYSVNMDGLTRVDLLMRLLGNPQGAFESVVIAGTKGKGSVAVMIESALREAGHLTGLYTSPHLHTFRERIRVGGEMIPPSDMARLVAEIKPIVDKIAELDEPTLMPTTYELATALAFQYFREEGVEIAVLEVGLGGRLDAVNITKPLISVITPISLDHTQVLGDTIELIAEEKAGIIKTGGDVIVSIQPEEATNVIKRIAAARRAHFSQVGQAVYVSTHHLPEVVSDERGIPVYQAFSLAYDAGASEPAGKLRVKLPLLGSHQQLNSAVALAALRALQDKGVKIGRGAILSGFSKAKWPGRLEIVRGETVVVLDGAHNVDSMSKLNQAIWDLFYGRPVILVFGTSNDKDVKGMIGEFAVGPANVLGPRVEKVIVTRTHHPRAAHPETVADIVRERGLFVETRENVAEALATAMSIARAGSTEEGVEPIVVVTGSLFLVAEARQYFGLAPDLSEEN